MKTSEALKAAKPFLMSAENLQGDSHICNAVAEAEAAGYISRAEHEAAVKQVMNGVWDICPGYTTLFGAHAEVGWADGIEGSDDLNWWPIRDAWLDALILKLEEQGD